MLVLFYTVWCAAGLVPAAAACRMLGNGLAKRYWLLATYLAVHSLRYLVLAALWRHQSLYSEVWEVTMAPVMILECAAIISVFFVLVENYKAFRKIAGVGIALLIVIGTILAWSTRNLGVPFSPGVRESALLWQRYGALILVGLLAGISLLLPRTQYLPLRNSAQRATAILTIDSAQGLATPTLAVLLTGWTSAAPLWTKWLATLLPMVFHLSIGALWLFWMTPASDADPKIVKLSEEEIERHRVEIVQRAHLLIAEVRDAERRLGNSS